MSSAEGIYELRLMREKDIPFIMSTFLKGLYYGNASIQLVDKRIFMDNYKRFAEVLLNTSAVIVACLKEDHDVILGYSVVSSDTKVIHWCFVKSAWRKKGIAKALIPSNPVAITHYTQFNVGKIDEESAKEAINRLLRRFENCVYNPFAIV